MVGGRAVNTIMLYIIVYMQGRLNYQVTYMCLYMKHMHRVSQREGSSGIKSSHSWRG